MWQRGTREQAQNTNAYVGGEDHVRDGLRVEESGRALNNMYRETSDATWFRAGFENDVSTTHRMNASPMNFSGTGGGHGALARHEDGQQDMPRVKKPWRQRTNRKRKPPRITWVSSTAEAKNAWSMESHKGGTREKFTSNVWDIDMVQVWSNGDVTITSGKEGCTPAAKVVLNLVLAIFKAEVILEEDAKNTGETRWKIQHKSGYKQEFKEGMCMSLFADRDWALIKTKLKRLPVKIFLPRQRKVELDSDVEEEGEGNAEDEEDNSEKEGRKRGKMRNVMRRTAGSSQLKPASHRSSGAYSYSLSNPSLVAAAAREGIAPEVLQRVLLAGGAMGASPGQTAPVYVGGTLDAGDNGDDRYGRGHVYNQRIPGEYFMNEGSIGGLQERQVHQSMYAMKPSQPVVVHVAPDIGTLHQAELAQLSDDPLARNRGRDAHPRTISQHEVQPRQQQIHGSRARPSPSPEGWKPWQPGDQSSPSRGGHESDNEVMPAGRGSELGNPHPPHGDVDVGDVSTRPGDRVSEVGEGGSSSMHRRDDGAGVRQAERDRDAFTDDVASVGGRDSPDLVGESVKNSVDQARRDSYEPDRYDPDAYDPGEVTVKRIDALLPSGSTNAFDSDQSQVPQRYADGRGDSRRREREGPPEVWNRGSYRFERNTSRRTDQDRGTRRSHAFPRHQRVGYGPGYGYGASHRRHHR